jgi:hypothetical protein
MNRGHIILIKGRAVFQYNEKFVITDLEKFKKHIKEKRNDLETYFDFFSECIYNQNSDILTFFDRDAEEFVNDVSCEGIEGWSDEVKQIISENNLDDLDVWHETDKMH